MNAADATRRNVSFPDDLRRRIEASAAKAGADRGGPMTPAGWVWTACEETLARDDEERR